jgi:hypothetical protein
MNKGRGVLLTGRPRTASVKVLQSTELVRLTKKISKKSRSDKLQALGVFRDSPAKEGRI